MKASVAYNSYVNKLVKVSTTQQAVQDVKSQHLLADYLHMYVDGKWKKLWMSLRADGQLDLYQSRTNLKPFDHINLISERVKYETDYNAIKKILANYTANNQHLSSNSVSSSSSSAQFSYKTEEVNLYEQVENQTDFTTSLVILLYSSKICVQLGFDSFSKKIIWLDALQSSCLIGPAVGAGIPLSNSSGNISKKANQLSLPGSQTNDVKFKSFNLDRALNPFLELSDFLSVNSYCFINENLIALACDDGLYVSAPIDAGKSPCLSLVKINTIESAHKLNYNKLADKLCIIGRRSRQLLAIDISDLANAKVIHKNFNDDLSNNEDEDEAHFEDYDDDEKLINVKIEHIHSIDRCHLFESTLTSGGNWYSAVATPETIFVLLYNQTSCKFSLIKTINTQHDSPCLCVKFSHRTNQLIYGCTKEFYRMDLSQLQAMPIVDTLLSNAGKKIMLNDEELVASGLKKKQPIGVCVISLENQTESESILLCYEDYALVLSYNSSSQQWQLQTAAQAGSSKKSNSSTSIGTSHVSPVSNVACLKWPRSLPPLQVEYDSPNLYLFYNDSIIVYRVNYEAADATFVFKKLGIAFIYKPRFLSSMHNNHSNCIIISNRRTNTSAGETPSEISDIVAGSNRVYSDYDTENEYNNEDESNEDDLRSSSTKMNNSEQEDRICLSHFSPYDWARANFYTNLINFYVIDELWTWF